MVQCRFFHAEHSYSMSECDKVFCYEALERPQKRAIPLDPEPDPGECTHENCETVFAKLYSPGSRMLPGRRHAVLSTGRVVMTERRFDICLKCGMITYHHESLGTVKCLPVSYGK